MEQRRVDGVISQHEQHFIEMMPGDVMIIAPTDGHKPRCAVREGVPERKIVVKVRVDYYTQRLKYLQLSPPPEAGGQQKTTNCRKLYRRAV